MRGTLWNEESRRLLVERLNRLESTATPRWGRFPAPQMLAHLGGWMQMATGDHKTRPKPGMLRRSPMKQFAIYWMPWPKGVPTAAELLGGEAVDWIAERDAIARYISDFANRHSDRKFPDHPAFGRLSPEAWGVLGYRHTDHHLRQFGA